MQEFHNAAKAIEADGVEGFWKAVELVGDEIAFALLTAHIRRSFGSMGSWPANPDINPMVNGVLSQKISEVYAVLSQNPILFYSRRWYCFDNFSAFTVKWYDKIYPTAEHVYQVRKYIGPDGIHIQTGGDGDIAELIRAANSAHEAKKLGKFYKEFIRKDWSEETKLQIMEEILRAKLAQHEYVRKELLASKGMLLVENSNKDPFWGRGEFWTGENHQGRIWMKLRDEIT